MAASPPNVTQVKVEDYVFPPTVKAPGSDKSFFLGGAGVRGLEIEGKFIKFTAIGVYLEECGISSLACKWKGKSNNELANSLDFFRDVVTGPFEKFTQVTMILPLTGQQYSEKVMENCVAFWKSVGIYTDEEAKAVEKFLEAFKDEKFPPGHSIVFTQSPLGSLTVYNVIDKCKALILHSEWEITIGHCYREANRAADWLANLGVGLEEKLQIFQNIPRELGYIIVEDFSGVAFSRRVPIDGIGFCKHDCIPEAGNVVIENKNLAEAILESIIGEHGVSPEAKQSLATRVAELLNQEEVATVENVANGNGKVVEGVAIQHDVKA